VKADRPSLESYGCASWMLDCEREAIIAVASVESGVHDAFLDTGEPVILTEPHLFHQFTGGRFDKSHPELSYPKWKPGNYPPPGKQHARLAQMMKLDRDAAIKATSWGLFQVLGANYRRAGFATPQAMVNAAYDSVDAQLRMFVMFILLDPKRELQPAIQLREWEKFADGYNGPRHAENNYAPRMAAAYAKAKGSSGTAKP